MHPATHLLVSWTVAESARLSKRDRTLVTLAGVLPDIDGLGVIAEIATENSPSPLYWWSEYHHFLCHNIGFCVLILTTAVYFATKRWTVIMLGAIAFHLHLLGDIVGSRGSDGYPWPVPYLLPFSGRWQLTWDGQWELNAWPNIALTVVLLALTLYLAWKRGYSPLGMVSSSADAAFIATLRKRFGAPRRSRA